LIAALIVPPIVLILSWHRDAGNNVAPERATFALDPSSKTVAVSASVALSWAPAAQVRAPDWKGLVTEVLVGPGNTPQSGDSLVRIDGVLIRYFVLDTPLYQPTCANDTALVDEVRTILRRSDHPVGATEMLSPTDVRSIREYAKEIGVADASSVDCFSPTWIASSTQPLGEVSEVNLSVGALSPTQGEPILVGHAMLESLALRGTTGVPSLDEALDADGAKTFADTELLINGESSGIGLDAIDEPASLSMLAPRFDPKVESTTIAVIVTLADSQYVVPATSVVGALAAQSCVEDAASGSIVPVHVVNSSVSGLIVDFLNASAVGSINTSPDHSSCE